MISYYNTRPGEPVKWSLPLLLSPVISMNVNARWCVVCGAEIPKRAGVSWAKYNTMTCCSPRCGAKTRIGGAKIRTTASEMNRFRAWLENENYKVVTSEVVGVLFSVHKSGAYRQVKRVDDFHYALGCGLKSLYADSPRS